jgi:WD40 repeat protein
MMKTFELPTPENDELTELQLIEMSAENFTIATNNVDKIAFGGAEKMVVVHSFVQEQGENGKYLAKIEGDPFIGLIFNSAVQKIEFFGANQLLAISEDSTAKVVDLETGKMTDFICGKHNGSIKSAAVDPLDEFLATIGSDGTLHIMNLKSNTLLK